MATAATTATRSSVVTASAAALRRARAIVGTEGLLLLAAVLVVNWDRLERPLAGFVDVYPYGVLLTGLVFAWRFQRSRLLFALVLLALADRAVARFAGGFVFHATALLLPLNLAANAVLPERGVATPAGLRRWGAIVAQVVLVASLADQGARAAAALRFALLPRSLFAWTPLAQPALLAFAVALALVVTAWVFSQNPTARGYCWALVAAFLALSAGPTGPGHTVYSATAGFILLAAVIEASYILAYQDTLTGLPGRRAFTEALPRLGDQYAVAMVDVDRFKQFNDTYGHDIGDQVLRMVATRLAAVSGGGKAYRYGGEEFAVLFSGRSVEDCLPALEEVRRLVADTPFTIRGRLRPRKAPKSVKPGTRRRKQVAITVSIGVAQRNSRQGTPEQVIQAADRALYRAKDEGRNRVAT